ncbi:rhodanese-like domain-containing protein [Paucidesulfovibrio gracilis]|nr:rhodanese-like domain-containing protein [Paucidesulfovibrio gracilis]
MAIGKGRPGRFWGLMCVVLMLLPGVAQGQDDFPLRPFYPAVSVVDSETLLKIYPRAVIVDVRSEFEYEVARINKAVNAPIAHGRPLAVVERIRARDASSPLVFYCNDPACSRAFRVAQEAVNQGWENVYVYDAGVFAWIAAAPDKATLMGNSPASLERVISPALYRRHLLAYDEFERLSYEPGALVVDIRDIYHREREPRLRDVRNIPMESLLQAVTNRVWVERRLLIFDADGGQTRWLQYFLQANGYTDYYFLDGGVESLGRSAKTRLVDVGTSSVSFSQHNMLRLLKDRQIQELDRRLLLYVAARLRFDNYALLVRSETMIRLGVDEGALFEASDRLARSGWLLYTRVNGSLVYRVNPRLAWRGEMEGKVWMSRVHEFEKAVGR